MQDLGTSGKETVNSKLTQKRQGIHWADDLQELMQIKSPNDTFEEQGIVSDRYIALPAIAQWRERT